MEQPARRHERRDPARLYQKHEDRFGDAFFPEKQIDRGVVHRLEGQHHEHGPQGLGEKGEGDDGAGEKQDHRVLDELQTQDRFEGEGGDAHDEIDVERNEKGKEKRDGEEDEIDPRGDRHPEGENNEEEKRDAGENKPGEEDAQGLDQGRQVQVEGQVEPQDDVAAADAHGQVPLGPGLDHGEDAAAHRDIGESLEKTQAVQGAAAPRVHGPPQVVRQENADQVAQDHEDEIRPEVERFKEHVSDDRRVPPHASAPS